MVVLNKRELQKVACNHALEIGLKSLKKVIYFYKKPIKKHILVINKTALAWDNPLCFRPNLLERDKK